MQNFTDSVAMCLKEHVMIKQKKCMPIIRQVYAVLTSAKFKPSSFPALLSRARRLKQGMPASTVAKISTEQTVTTVQEQKQYCRQHRRGFRQHPKAEKKEKDRDFEAVSLGSEILPVQVPRHTGSNTDSLRLLAGVSDRHWRDLYSNSPFLSN